MNTTPRSPIVTNTRGHPSEFQQIITEKSKNFVGREFVFAAINEFLHKYPHGYFTLIGAPGSGKTAILAKYVTENPHIIAVLDWVQYSLSPSQTRYINENQMKAGEKIRAKIGLLGRLNIK